MPHLYSIANCVGIDDIGITSAVYYINMNKIKIAYFGAPGFSAGVLQRILDDKGIPVSVELVVTQPDKPAGREQILTPTPVKLLAQKYNIPVFDTLHVTRATLHEIDLALLYAYGEIIPPDVLNIPRWGFWNIHPSLLPKYRGPSPITYPLLLGDKQTGVSLIEMDERLDHGKIIDQKEYMIESSDTQESLRKRLSDEGYELFKKNIQLLLDGALQKKEQIHEKRTFTRLLTKQDGFIPLPIVQKILRGESITKDEIPPIISEYFTKYGVSPTIDYRLTTFDLFRALSPWPGLWTLIPLNGVEKRLKITGITLSTNHYPLITHVQLEGKKEVDFAIFNSAYKVF